MVERETRFELATSSLARTRSSQLSYTRIEESLFYERLGASVKASAA